MSCYETCEHKTSVTATKSTTVAIKSSHEATNTSIINGTTQNDGNTLTSKERCALLRAKDREETTKSFIEATETTTMNKDTANVEKTAIAASKAAKATKTSSKGGANVEKMKKQAILPFISFTTREMRDKYSALPDGSIVENVGKAQKYVCHLDDLDKIECFRIFTHHVPYETRTTMYSHVIFVSMDETPMKQQVLGIMYFHKNLKTVFASEAEKWLAMMKEGVRIFMTDDGFTTVDPIMKKRVEKAKAAKAKTTKPKTTTTTVPANEVVVEETKKFVPVPPPKVNAWSNPLVKSLIVPAPSVATEDTAVTKSETEETVVETVPQSIQEEVPTYTYDGEWQIAGKTVKKAPKYFICMERGFSLKVTYGDNGRPSIVQMKPNGTSTVIGWTSEMKAHGFKHMRTPEGHHMFFKNSHLKVPLMIQCLDYTVKNSTDAEQLARAREVLSWKKKFIIKNSSGDLEWADTYKTPVATTAEDEPPSITEDAYPELGSA